MDFEKLPDLLALRTSTGISNDQFRSQYDALQGKVRVGDALDQQICGGLADDPLLNSCRG